VLCPDLQCEGLELAADGAKLLVRAKGGSVFVARTGSGKWADAKKRATRQLPPRWAGGRAGRSLGRWVVGEMGR
jgi:hypothetical protein